MKIDIRGVALAGLVGLGLFVTGAAAQHDHHDSQAAAPADTASGMPKMMAEQKEISSLVDRLVASEAAMEAETDPAALKQQLSEHGMMLKDLQARLERHAHRMQTMHSMMESESKK